MQKMLNFNNYIASKLHQEREDKDGNKIQLPSAFDIGNEWGIEYNQSSQFNSRIKNTPIISFKVHDGTKYNKFSWC